jgi:hypothetical protein
MEVKMVHFVHTTPTGLGITHTDATQRARQAARKLYRRAYTLGWWGKVWAKLSRQEQDLRTLSEIEANQAAGNRYSAGLQLVPLSQIQGSQSRCHDFDRNFYPLQDHLESRWLRVATAYELGLTLPPVELVQVGDIYFVRDGHHRISVAKAFGQLEIYAEVRVWECGQ